MMLLPTVALVRLLASAPDAAATDPGATAYAVEKTGVLTIKDGAVVAWWKVLSGNSVE
jgi:hypothetical protein